MPRDWERIRQARLDITDWVIHWTKSRMLDQTSECPLDVLKCILQLGYLKPSFAPRRSVTIRKGQTNTIQGSYPAVCFTDQPLSSFTKSCRTLSSRYSPYGVALDKRNLFEYGGRPVIYGDKNLLARLNDEDKYLWVGYNPVPSSSFSGYPLDWTHEREWRTKVEKYNFLDWGLTPDEGIPLVLPPIHNGKEFVIALPKILVRTVEEAKDLREWLAGLPKYEGMNGFIKKLYENLTQLWIVPLDFINERLEIGDTRWARFETLLYDEIPERDSEPQTT